MVHAVGVPARRAVGLGSREHFEVLLVGYPQIDQPNRAIVLLQPQHLGEAQLVHVIVERAIEVGHLDRDVAEAVDSLHCPPPLWRFPPFDRRPTGALAQCPWGTIIRTLIRLKDISTTRLVNWACDGDRPEGGAIDAY